MNEDEDAEPPQSIPPAEAVPGNQPSPPADNISTGEPIPPAENVAYLMHYDADTPSSELVRQIRTLLRRGEAMDYARFAAHMEAIPRVAQLKRNDSGNFVALAHEATGYGKSTNYDIVAWLVDRVEDIWQIVNAEASAAQSRGEFYEYPKYTTLVKLYKPGPTPKESKEAKEAKDKAGEDVPAQKGNRSREAISVENLHLQDEAKRLIAEKATAVQQWTELREQHDRLRQNHREQAQLLDEARERFAIAERGTRELRDQVSALEQQIDALRRGDNVLPFRILPTEDPPDDEPPPVTEPSAKELAKQIANTVLPEEGREAAFYAAIERLIALGVPLSDADKDALEWMRGLTDADGKAKLFHRAGLMAVPLAILSRAEVAKRMGMDWDRPHIARVISTPPEALPSLPLPEEDREAAFFAATDRMIADGALPDSHRAALDSIHALDAPARDHLFRETWDGEPDPTPLDILNRAVAVQNLSAIQAQLEEMRQVVCPGEMEQADVIVVEVRHRLKSMKRGVQSSEDWQTRAVRAEYIVAHEAIGMGTGILSKDRKFWAPFRGATVGAISTAATKEEPDSST